MQSFKVLFQAKSRMNWQGLGSPSLCGCAQPACFLASITMAHRLHTVAEGNPRLLCCLVQVQEQREFSCKMSRKSSTGGSGPHKPRGL